MHFLRPGVSFAALAAATALSSIMVPACASAGSSSGVAAEGGAPFSCSSATPSLGQAVAPLLIANCSGELCHGGTAAGGFGGAQGAHAALVNVPATRDPCDAGVLVSPGSLPRSYLMNKVTGVGLCPGTSAMPPGHSLRQMDIQTITDWICSGAPDN
ncbi:MAG: hypothetical protein M3O36_05180 [Myxococcota bacterium]|nr:hypothetical protein [Myxococcota bacterium]